MNSYQKKIVTQLKMAVSGMEYDSGDGSRPKQLTRAERLIQTEFDRLNSRLYFSGRQIDHLRSIIREVIREAEKPEPFQEPGARQLLEEVKEIIE